MLSMFFKIKKKKQMKKASSFHKGRTQKNKEISKLIETKINIIHYVNCSSKVSNYKWKFYNLEFIKKSKRKILILKFLKQVNLLA